MYIDAEGGFSIERFIQMNSKNGLENLILSEPKTFEEQDSMINNIERELKLEKDIGLIIVDSIVALYRLDLHREKIQEVNRILSRQLPRFQKSQERIRSL